MAAILKVWRHIRDPTQSVNRCVFTWRAILPNFIPMRFETTKPLRFFKNVTPSKKNNWSAYCFTVVIHCIHRRHTLLQYFCFYSVWLCLNFILSVFVANKRTQAKHWPWLISFTCLQVWQRGNVITVGRIIRSKSRLSLVIFHNSFQGC